MILHPVDTGIDVLNAVQPECMDFKEICAMHGDRGGLFVALAHLLEPGMDFK